MALESNFGSIVLSGNAPGPLGPLPAMLFGRLAVIKNITKVWLLTDEKNPFTSFLTSDQVC